MKTLKNMLENFTKFMVQPLMYLSVAGIVMVFAVMITNKQFTQMLPFLNFAPIQLFGSIIYNCIMVIINNLSVVFAVGIAAAMAKKDKHQAALIGLMSYLMYLTASNTVLTHTGQLAEANGMLGLIGTGQSSILGIQNLDMSVFGGIIMGCLTGTLYNKTCTKQFNGAFQIYSGVRFSFFVMIFASIAVGFVSTYLWPFVQQGINMLAGMIKNTGNFGLFLYGFLERLLVPTGLHHLVYTPFQFTDIGGVLQLGDQTIAGAYPIVMAEMNMEIDKFSDSIFYMATGFVKMYGYIGIGAAFIYTAYKENRAKTKAMIIPLVVTAALASITEPIDFMFVFISPLLYFIHSVIAGGFIALLSIFDVTAFTGGNLITSSIMNVAFGAERTNFPMLFVLGISQIVIYFLVFTFLIQKLDLKTPGREKREESDGEEFVNKELILDETTIETLIDGLGGYDNINELDNCFTRLRVNVKNPDSIDESKLAIVKNSGLVKKDNDIQVIYGLVVPEIRNSIEQHMKGAK